MHCISHRSEFSLSWICCLSPTDERTAAFKACSCSHAFPGSESCVACTVCTALLYWLTWGMTGGLQASALKKGHFLLVCRCSVLWVRPTCCGWVYFQMTSSSPQIPPASFWLPATAARTHTNMSFTNQPCCYALPPRMHTHAHKATDKHRTLSPWQPLAHAISTGWWNLAG